MAISEMDYYFRRADMDVLIAEETITIPAGTSSPTVFSKVEIPSNSFVVLEGYSVGFSSFSGTASDIALFLYQDKSPLFFQKTGGNFVDHRPDVLTPLNKRLTGKEIRVIATNADAVNAAVMFYRFIIRFKRG